MKKIVNLILLIIPFLTINIVWLNYQYFEILKGDGTWSIYVTYWLSAYFIYFASIIYLLLLKDKFYIYTIMICLIEFLISILFICLNDLWFIMFISNLTSNVVMCITLLIIYFLLLLEHLTQLKTFKRINKN